MRAAFYADVSPTALRALNYAPEVEAFRRRRERPLVRLGDVVQDLGCGYGKRLLRVDCDEPHGQVLLSQSDLFATVPTGRRIVYRANSDGDMVHQIRRWDLLIAGAGTLGETELFGRGIIADRRLVGSLADEHVFGLRFTEPESDVPLYVAAVLSTPTGVRLIRSTAFGTKILSLRRKFLATLPIPLGTNEQVARVASLVRATVTEREAYASHLREARGLLEKIPSFVEARRLSERRGARVLHWTGPLPTLSAWTFAFAGEALKVLRARWSLRLRDVTRPEGLTTGDRSARVACERPHGIDFASQRDVFMMRRFPRRIAVPPQGTGKLFVDADTVLIACDGQAGEGTLLGRAELGACGLTSTAITEHILKVPLLSERRWVYALLSSPLGRQLLQSCAVGTSIPKLRMDLVAQLPIPDLSPELAQWINAAVDAAVTARLAADRAESEAVRIIEQEVLPAWLA